MDAFSPLKKKRTYIISWFADQGSGGVFCLVGGDSFGFASAKATHSSLSFVLLIPLTASLLFWKIALHKLQRLRGIALLTLTALRFAG